MTTYTWLGVSAPWTSASFWTVGGTSTGGVPGYADDAIIAAPGTYTVSIPGTRANSDAVFVDHLTMTDPNATLAVASAFLAGANIAGGIINAGTIAIADGAYVQSSAYGGSFINTGVVVIGNGATLDVYSANAAALGTIQNNGGTVFLHGTVDNTGATLSSAALGNLVLAGTIENGLVRNDGNVLSFASPSFDGIAFQGAFDVRGFVTILNDFTVHGLDGTSVGTINDSGLLAFNNSVTLDNAVLNLQGVNGFSNLFSNQTLTLGANLHIHTSLQFGSGNTIGGDSLILDGTLDGTGVEVTAAGFINNGVLENTSGVIRFILNPLANNGLLMTSGGSIALLHGVSGAGTIAIDAGGTAELHGSYDQQQFNMIGSDDLLSLNFVSGTNTIRGFAPGNTLELAGIPASVVFAAGTLTVSNGALTLASFLLPDVAPNAQFQAVTDGSSNTFITETIPCFAAGTRIRTPDGEIAVEDLRVGMRVVSAFGGDVAVQWVGRRDLVCARFLRPRDVWPVRVRAHAFGPGLPRRDLRLSGDHAVYVEGVLIPVRYLINGHSIVQEAVREITYLHVELPMHDVILAEGLPAESYLDTGNRATFANGGPARRQPAHLAWHVWDEQGCAELVLAGPRLEAVRRGLDEIAAGRERRAA